MEPSEVLIFPTEIVSEILTHVVFSGVKNPGKYWCLSRNIYKNWVKKFLDLSGEIPDDTAGIVFIRGSTREMYKSLRSYTLTRSAQYVCIKNIDTINFVQDLYGFQFQNLKTIDCGGARIGSKFIQESCDRNLYNYIYIPKYRDGPVVKEYFPESYALFQKFEEICLSQDNPSLRIVITSEKTTVYASETFLSTKLAHDVLPLAEHVLVNGGCWSNRKAKKLIIRLSKYSNLAKCIISTNFEEVYNKYTELIRDKQLENFECRREKQIYIY